MKFTKLIIIGVLLGATSAIRLTGDDAPAAAPAAEKPKADAPKKEAAKAAAPEEGKKEEGKKEEGKGDKKAAAASKDPEDEWLTIPKFDIKVSDPHWGHEV